jgi:hypothetical protein
MPSGIGFIQSLLLGHSGKIMRKLCKIKKSWKRIMGDIPTLEK